MKVASHIAVAIGAIFLGLAAAETFNSYEKRKAAEQAKLASAPPAKYQLNFDKEADRVTAALGCPAPKFTGPQYTLAGTLYGCIMGGEQTAKFWINEDQRFPGTVANVKVIWNDWKRNLGYGLHSDRPEAEHMVEVMSQLYAPELKQDLLKAFRGSEARSFETDRVKIKYEWTPGPGIDEHLLVLTPR